MRYSGGKYRLSKYIAKIIQNHRKLDQIYLEPFVGAANVVAKLDGVRIASDYNSDLIAFWQAIQMGYIPNDCLSKEEYNLYKYNQSLLDSVPHYRGFVSHFCSYSGKFWDGYAQYKSVDYINMAMRSAVSMKPLIQNVFFFSGDYIDLWDNVSDYMIYCDPPYAGTRNGYSNKHWNSERFWNQCRKWKENGNTVIISEYTAPNDFRCIWEKPVKTSLSKDNYGQRIERLFI